MPTNRVTLDDAEATLAAVKAHFAGEDQWGQPNLRGNDHEALAEGSWSIDWEEGPDEWAIRFSAEVKTPGVFCEPIMAFILGLHPDN